MKSIVARLPGGKICWIENLLIDKTKDNLSYHRLLIQRWNDNTHLLRCHRIFLLKVVEKNSFNNSQTQSISPFTETKQVVRVWGRAL